MSSELEFMNAAMRLAEKGRGFTSPNPVVGAVVVKDGLIVGQGWHAKFGGPHAEIGALREAGDRGRGATLYVTLEPCDHQGKTPPCTRAILDARVRRVVLGAADPNPEAAGGMKRLRESGIEVIEGVLSRECREQNAPFFRKVRTGRPLVSAKWAMSLDGKIATRSGDSKWITSEASRRMAHQIRAFHDAVLVGVGTILADSPRLNVRLDESSELEPNHQPIRVILDPSGRMPTEGPFWEEANAGPILVFTSTEVPEERIKRLESGPSKVVPLNCSKGLLPLDQVLETLAAEGVLSVMVEGGAETLGRFLDARLVDRGFVFLATKIIGGKKGVSAVAGEGVDLVCDAQALRDVKSRRLEDDYLLEGKLGDWDWLR